MNKPQHVADKPSAPSAAARDEKREAILKAARECFAEHGFAATRISDIAQRAGIGKGTVYEYIRSKEDLLLEACLSSCHANEEKISNTGTITARADDRFLVDSSIHPVRAAFEVLRNVLNVVLTQNQGEHRLFSELQSICMQRPDISARTREQFGAKLQTWMETAFQLGKQGMAQGFFHEIDDPEYRWCARLVVAAVDGLLWQSAFLPQQDPSAVAHNIAAAWVRLHLKEPSKFATYLSDTPAADNETANATGPTP